MYKLFVLAALFAVAVAAPSHLVESPLVYSAPSAVAYQEPVLAKVGSVVKSIPTAVSHQSQSIVHSSAHVVEDVLAPVVKTSYVPAPVVKTIHSAPLVHTSYVAAAPVIKSYAAAPVVHSYAAPLSYDGHYSSW
ncbi:cuticle protein LPCP-23-like [Anastrepha obliqua]|uniref:cuticle protein LPCP-23-like n=1 Tax=Anastrepha ludens TaxID=28586 RepID=UPI0023B15989|nr:cuticle protein LPCP-23-like [Anastrepha ludens]XP_054733443.1 cuticle protein LPCP-23-like [Anastrepha obliqua]XP_054733605.1 cuticle protein LPCP-23-like [Anastrepha obliqua]